MFRTPVHVRDASPDDAAHLVEVWGAHRAAESHDAILPAVDEAAASVARVTADPDQRILIAFNDEQVAGAAHLMRGPITPIHADDAVYVMHLQVLEGQRRHGVGRALLEASLRWAEEKGSAHLLTAAAVGSRDANRFMARLGLGQIAVVRGATVASLRAKLPVEPPAVARVGSRSHRVGQVLVQRRSLRRSQAHSS
jgi:GNAT superfamily N-acetyltransferase